MGDVLSATPWRNTASGALLSSCKRYRYALWRVWDPSKPLACFVMLNPSTADAETDDSTIVRCVRFARDDGYGGIVVVNLYAWRATDPKELLERCTWDDIVGPENAAWIERAVFDCGITIAAWGSHRFARDRAAIVRRSLGRTHVLRLNKDGTPAHPLYLPAECRAVEWAA